MAGIRQRERLDREGSLPAKAEGLPTPNKKGERRSGYEQLADGARSLKNLLEVVENEQDSSAIDEVGDGSQRIARARPRGPRHARDRRENKCRVAGSGEVDESHRVEAFARLAEVSSGGGRESGLSHASGPE